MTQDRIIELARAAGCHDNGREFRFVELRYLERFAALVRNAALEDAAGVCNTLGVHPALNVYGGGPDWYKHGKQCASAIRALKGQP